jgi:hypothetical protein
MTATIVVTAMIGALIILLGPARARLLREHLPQRSVVLAPVGTYVEVVGLNAGGMWGHLCVAAGISALLIAAWPLRSWRGGRLLFIGVALNSLAMMLYGRMPITPSVLATLDLSHEVGTELLGSKDIVMDSAVAQWLGDRFVLTLPLINRTTVWSAGDLLMLMGILRAGTAGRASYGSQAAHGGGRRWSTIRAAARPGDDASSVSAHPVGLR